jgi:hypothetical protein
VGPLCTALAGVGPLCTALAGVGPLCTALAGVGPLCPPRRRGQYQPVACEWFHALRGDPYRALM